MKEGNECVALLKHRKQLEQGFGTKVNNFYTAELSAPPLQIAMATHKCTHILARFQAEQFFCHLADLPRLVPRLRCMQVSQHNCCRTDDNAQGDMCSQFRCAYDAEEKALSVKVSILHEVKPMF